MSLVMSSPSHGSTASLAGSDSSGATHDQDAGAAKKRKRDGDVQPLLLPAPPLLFPSPLDTDKRSTGPLPTFDSTAAMLAVAGMFDVQALRSVDAWISEASKQQQQHVAASTATGSEDMVKTASDILRSFVDHKLTSSSSSGDKRQQLPTDYLLALTGAGGKVDLLGLGGDDHRHHQGHQQVSASSKSTPGGGEEKAAECSECGKAFKSKTDLLRHIDAEHSVGAAKMFKCDECPYETRHQSNLSVHRRTHTGERPYYCGACGQSYTQGHQLKTHIRSRHGGNMAFYNMDKHGMGRGPGRATFDLKMSMSGLQPPSASSSHSHASGGGSGKADKISQLLAAASSAGRSAASVSSSHAQLAPSFPGLGTSSAMDVAAAAPFMGLLPSHLGSLRPFLEPANFALPGNLLGSSAAASANLFSHFFPFNTPPAALLSATAAAEKQSSVPLSSLFASTSSVTSSSSIFSNVLNSSTTQFQMTAPGETLDSICKLPATSAAASEGSSTFSFQLNPLPTADNSGKCLTTGSTGTMLSSNGNGETKPDNQVHLSHIDQQEDAATRPEDLCSPPAVPQDESHYDSSCDLEPEMAAENGVESEHVFRDESGDICVYVEPEEPEEDVPTPAERLPCSHRDQLVRLRQHVMRMLSVLAPNLGLDKLVDLNTTQIDDLLHEVLFGNLSDGIPL